MVAPPPSLALCFAHQRPLLTASSAGAAAGVERNAKIGDDEEARKRDIPIVQVRCFRKVKQCMLGGVVCLCGGFVSAGEAIASRTSPLMQVAGPHADAGLRTDVPSFCAVPPSLAHLPTTFCALQLNPGAVLNHKYTGEAAVRAAGLPYCVLRPTGLTNETEPGDFLLEASQGVWVERGVWMGECGGGEGRRGVERGERPTGLINASIPTSTNCTYQLSGCRRPYHWPH